MQECGSARNELHTYLSLRLALTLILNSAQLRQETHDDPCWGLGSTCLMSGSRSLRSHFPLYSRHGSALCSQV